MNGVGHLESEIKEDEGDAGLSGIGIMTHTSMSRSLNNLIRIFTLEKEGLRKEGGGEGKSPSEGIFANTP